MGKVLNFDQFLSEKQKETIAVTVYGKEYLVPMTIPASVPIMMARAEESLDGKQSTRMIMKAADVMFGTAAIDEMCDKGMSASDLATLVQQIFKQINGGGDDDDEQEEVSDEDSRKQTGEGKNAKK